MSPSRLLVSLVEVMSEFGGQAVKGLLMGNGRISWVLPDKEHSKGKNSSRIYSHLSHLREPGENITPVVRGCFVHSTSHLGFGPRSQPVVGMCLEEDIW